MEITSFAWDGAVVVLDKMANWKWKTEEPWNWGTCPSVIEYITGMCKALSSMIFLQKEEMLDRFLLSIQKDGFTSISAGKTEQEEELDLSVGPVKYKELQHWRRFLKNVGNIYLGDSSI